MPKTVPFTGAQAAAYAMKQINPEVVAAYPITPQTPIMEEFSQYVADGEVDTELIRVESEHSAMSATSGASAAGVRAMTATSSAGLALMFEVVGVTSGLRLPVVMNIVNRALSAPINIHCDHNDSMACRDSSWIQLYSENAQEVYENTLLALRLAEKVLLPVMVMQDGFITSHSVENVTLQDDNVVKNFIGNPPERPHLLDVDNPITIGPLQLFDYYFETKRQQADAMEQAYKEYPKLAKELSSITGTNHGFFEKYKLDGAQVAIITLNSTAGTAKAVVDKMREQGKKVGLLKLRLFRPFPYKEIAKALEKIKAIAVLDRSESYGANPPILTEIKSALFDSSSKPSVQSYIFGLGGRDIWEKDIEKVFNELLAGKISSTTKYIGLR